MLALFQKENALAVFPKMELVENVTVPDSTYIPPPYKVAVFPEIKLDENVTVPDST